MKPMVFEDLYARTSAGVKITTGLGGSGCLVSGGTSEDGKLVFMLQCAVSGG